MKSNYKMYIDGEWTDAVSGEFYDDFNPFNGEIFGKIPDGGAADALKAIDAAAAAFPSWSKVSPSQRRRLMLKAADILESKTQEVADILANEVGAAMPFAMFQGFNGPEFLREAASQVHRVSGEILPSEVEGSMNMVWRQPVGVVAAISPWNAPLLLSLRAICFPIAYGNTVVLKPSTESAVSGGILLAQVFEEAGLPKGVLNVVTNGPGKSSEIGDVFTSDKRVRRITFTGSTEVGRILAEQAGKNLKKVTLELGCSSPLIVLKDADMEYAVNAAVFGRFIHQGQVCMSTKRIIVEGEIAEEFTKKFVSKVETLKAGDPRSKDTIIGPLINEKQKNILQMQLERAVEQGAQLAFGGSSKDLVFYPTVLTGVTENMDVFHEETFGPVASIITADNAEEALRLANNCDYGLSAGIITADVNKGIELAEKLEFGCTHINGATVHDESHVPFGGMKDSGWGRNGIEAVEEYTEIRWVTLQKDKPKFKF